MKYNDGYIIDENKRFIKCPQCNNEDYIDDAEFCRICGFECFNLCKGYRLEDENGVFLELVRHKNMGNARYCELCGEKTILFTKRLLVPYSDYLDNVKNSD